MAMNNKNDNRSKKIVFCSSCLLNTNNKFTSMSWYSRNREIRDILIINFYRFINHISKWS